MSCTHETLELHTGQPFGIAHWTHSVCPRTCVPFTQGNIQGGRTGRGEVAPNAFYGDMAATVQAVLPGLLECLTDPWDGDGLRSAMTARFPHHHPGVKCALEMASLEWCALSAGVPVSNLLGLSPLPVPRRSFTVSLAELPAMQQQAREAMQAGYRTLKVKLGTGKPDEPGRGAQIVEKLLEEIPDVALRIDANAAWVLRTAHRMLDVLDAAEVELVEQPIAADDLEGHAELRRFSRVPIMADESLHHLSDVPKLAVSFDAVNLKLAKLGGPLQALQALRTAHALKPGVMTGCMIEISLGIAAAVSLAGLCDWDDLDGALLADDPLGKLGRQAGTVQRTTAASWGWSAYEHASFRRLGFMPGRIRNWAEERVPSTPERMFSGKIVSLTP